MDENYNPFRDLIQVLWPVIIVFAIVLVSAAIGIGVGTVMYHNSAMYKISREYIFVETFSGHGGQSPEQQANMNYLGGSHADN